MSYEESVDCLEWLLLLSALALFIVCWIWDCLNGWSSSKSAQQSNPNGIECETGNKIDFLEKSLSKDYEEETIPVTSLIQSVSISGNSPTHEIEILPETKGTDAYIFLFSIV